MYKRQDLEWHRVLKLVGLVLRYQMAAGAGTGLAAWRAAPVSYTHLRAHETVLDLVCRLLLEKKNNEKT